VGEGASHSLARKGVRGKEVRTVEVDQKINYEDRKEQN
jgi:hypothetical protein